jgi:hypothetical protein
MLDPFRNMYDAARGGEEIIHRLSAIFLRDAPRGRPVHSGTKKLHEIRSGRTTFRVASIFMMITEPE